MTSDLKVPLSDELIKSRTCYGINRLLKCIFLPIFSDVMPAPPHTHNFGTIKTSSASQLRRTRIPSRSNPPPELAEWLRTFQVRAHVVALSPSVIICWYSALI